MGDELLPNDGMLSDLNQVHRCLKWAIGLMNEVIKFWIFHEIGRMIMQKIGFVLCVPFLLAMPNTLFADDTGCQPRDILFQFEKGAACLSAYATTIAGGEFHAEFEVQDTVRVVGGCWQQPNFPPCTSENADSFLALGVMSHSSGPIPDENPVHPDACSGFRFEAGYGLVNTGNLEVACFRERFEPYWATASAKAKLGVDTTNYRLVSEGRPTSIFTDYVAAITHELMAVANADEGQYARATADSESGFDDDVFWKADVPFRVAIELDVTLVLHAWRLDVNETIKSRGCVNEISDYQSTVWGGCGVYDAWGNPVEGLDNFALINGVDAWGNPVVVLGPGADMESDRLLGVLPPGDYFLRSWFHSDTMASVTADPGEDAKLLEIAAHNFEVSLYPHFADANGDGDVNVADFSVMLVNFGATVNDDDPFNHEEIPGDFNHDGVVNTADFSILLVQFGLIAEFNPNSVSSSSD